VFILESTLFDCNRYTNVNILKQLCKHKFRSLFYFEIKTNKSQINFKFLNISSSNHHVMFYHVSIQTSFNSVVLFQKKFCKIQDFTPTRHITTSQILWPELIGHCQTKVAQRSRGNLLRKVWISN
jgi:hypothetical protein